MIFTNTLIFANVILAYIVKELWKSNKKKEQIIKFQENMLKDKNLI